MKKTLLIFLTLVNISIFAQSNINKAFSDSYTKEYSANYSGAIESINKVYDDNSYPINLRLGWLNYMSADFKKSIHYYQIAFNLQPNSVEVLEGLLLPYMALENYSDNININKKILKLMPTNTTAMYNLAISHYYSKDYSSARTLLLKINKLYPFNYRSLVLLGWSNVKLNNLQEAKKNFNTALLVIPNDKSALEGLGIAK